MHRLSRVIPGFIAQPEHIAVLTTKYWGTQGVRLTVGFLDNPEAALRSRILQHMNAWNATANVLFVETSGQAQVRIARQDGANGGFWSFLGTDILSIEEDQPKMNLEAFTMGTLESEFHRVVRHETGHTIGFPHEHMRQELVDKIDPEKAIKFFGETQGWSPEEVRQQVLTPLEQSSLLGTPNADPNSIMCYQIPGSITKDGEPIVGGLDIDPSDFTFAATIYPKLITGSSVETSSAATSAGSAAFGVGPTVLEFSGGELTRITLNRPASGLSPKPLATPTAGIDQILQIASQSAILHYSWENRGVAPAGYIKGMAVVFARVYCKLAAGDPAAIEMAKAKTENGTRDVLAWYSERFHNEGMSNDTAGTDTLRHLFVLMVGLGMRESSGRYCEGRDRSASNTSSDTAEAGLFQTSFNARTASPLLPKLFSQYSANPSGFVEIFEEGVHVKPSDLENFGTGDGKEFQRLSKASPAFAAEFAAVGLRNIRTHWGPINARAAEIRHECDVMFTQVQAAVDRSNLCPV